MALFHAGVPRPLVTQALRHASARSDEEYILKSAKLTAVATAPRMLPPCRFTGAARASPASGTVVPTPRPPNGGRSATPCGSSSAW